MKILQWALTAVGALALLAVAVGYFLPSGFEVKRTVEVNAPPARVYDLVADPRLWAKWSAWWRRDPKMDVAYSGPLFGQGAKWSWKSRSEGSGSMEFVRVEPNARIEYALAFADMGMKSTGTWLFEPVAGGTRVTWTSTGDVGGNPLKHYIAVTMERMVGPDFEAGLANLKAVAESK
jgi:uncharacterized protein YndB with AHSA1/START domain